MTFSATTNPIPPPPSLDGAVAIDRSVGAWAKATKVLVGVVMSMSAVNSLLGVTYFQALGRFDRGESTLGSAIEVEERYRLSTLLWLLTYLVAGIVAINWLYRAAKNSKKIRPSAIEHQPKWAILGWFVPIYNLVRPLQMMRQTFAAGGTHDGVGSRTHDIIPWWWGLWLASGLVTPFAPNSSEVSDLRASVVLDQISNVLGLGAGVLFIAIVGGVTERQLVTARGPGDAARTAPAPATAPVPPPPSTSYPYV